MEARHPRHGDFWQRVETLFHAALQRPREERRRFLERASGGDVSLVADVERLLANASDADRQGFLRLDPRQERLAESSLEGSDSKRTLVGQHLGAYRIDALIGAGGMGEVYRAHDLKLHRDVALKFLPSALALDADRAARLRREARILASLNHANVATIHDLDEHGGVPFIVMEYVRGDTLKSKVADGPLPSSRIIGLALDIVDALDAAHHLGVIHRDIKSANIMVTQAGRAKVLDFGLSSRELGQTVPSEAGRAASDPTPVGGPVGYMSREQVRGEPIDPRSDLFSLGVVLYELATGELPFQGETPAEVVDGILRRDPWPIQSINPDIPDDLALMIASCLEKDPGLRVQTSQELRRRLGVLKGDPQESTGRPPDNLPKPVSRFIGRVRELEEIR